MDKSPRRKSTRAQHKNITNLFISGQKINYQKPFVYISLDKIPLSRYLLLHQNLSFQIKEEHFLYLGLLVIGICYGKWETTKKDVSTCFSKFQELTTGWQGKYLSMVGRLVLIKAVMGTLPAFLYRTCVVPKGIQDIFKWCMCQFLLGGNCSLHL